ncbi:MAG: WecB/TagA/CpsF family glycosyltransferase [Ignavibacteriaceae bacterium]
MKYYFYNTFVNVLNQEEYLEYIDKSLNTSGTTLFYYLNSYSFYLANNNNDFQKAMELADFVIADGYSIVKVLGKIHNININKVVFTYSFFSFLADFFIKNKLRIYFLGGKEAVIQKSIKKCHENYSDLKIAGYRNGYFNSQKESDQIIQNINNSKPDILIVGMGMPRAEIWIDQYKHQINAKCIFSVGGFFDFLASEKKIAPKFLYNSGFEWVFRMIQEPNRLAIRYLKANISLIIKFVRLKLKNY